MSARAYVEPDLYALRGGVQIHLKDDRYDGRVVLAEFADVVLHDIDPAAVTPPADLKPLRLTDDMARALYEALARHFGGAPDMAVLRRDYDAERARVDRFIDHFARQEPR